TGTRTSGNCFKHLRSGLPRDLEVSRFVRRVDRRPVSQDKFRFTPMNNKMPKVQTIILREPNYVFQSHEIHPSTHQTVRKFLHNSKNFNKKFCSSTESGNSSQSRLRVVRAVYVTNYEYVTLPPSYQLSWLCTMY
ncbi:hypothetical protein C0J52_19355, partial [Blattella germanica]